MKLKLTLIATSANRFTNRESSRFAFPPLSLATLAAHTPDEFEVIILDEAAHEVILDDYLDSDIVGLSTFTSTVKRGYEIADYYKKHNIPVIMGGHHVTALPDEALQHAATVVLGEAEPVWPKLLEDFKNGELRRTYKADDYYDLKGIPFARLELYPENANYLIRPNIHITRGCPHTCTFCSVTQFWGKKFRYRPVEDVIAELKHMKENFVDDSNRIVFNDDNFMANKRYAKELFRQMIPLNLKWQAFAGIDIADDIEFLTLCKAAGALGLFVGFDALNEEDLQATNKKVNTKRNYIEWVRIIQEDFGIPIIAGLMVGFDHDTVETFDMIEKFIVESRTATYSFNILYPYPGTPIFKQFEAEGRITSYDWDNYVMNGVNYIPKGMTQDELHDNYIRVVGKYATDEQIEKRAQYALATKMGKLGATMIRSWGEGIQRQYKELLNGADAVKRPKTA